MRDETKPVVDAIKNGVRTIENALREQTKAVVSAIKDGNSKPKQKVAFGWSVGRPTLKKRNTMPLELTLTNEQQVVVRLNPRTDAGKPAKLDGAPVWSVTSGPGKVVPADDGLSATLVTDDTDLSDTIYLVDGDADLGAGKEDVQDTITLHTQHANATNLGLVADAPTAKP